jgi:sulfate adenylyltransferase subunit 1
MPWYTGPTLLAHLETVEVAADRDVAHRRFPVQWVIRPMSDEHHDYRGYAGQVAGGVWRAGDDVLVLPAGSRSQVAAVEQADGAIDHAVAGLSVTIRLEDDLDVSRGDMLCDPNDQPVVARHLEATVAWMNEQPLRPGARLKVKHTTRTARAIVDDIQSVLDIESLEQDTSRHELELNDIGTVSLRLSAPLAVDAYAQNRATGSFILIDEATNDTVAAGMIRAAVPS